MKRKGIWAAILTEWMLTLNYDLLWQQSGGRLSWWGFGPLLAGFVLLNIGIPLHRRYCMRLEQLKFGSDVLIAFYIGFLCELAITAAWLFWGQGVCWQSAMWHGIMVLLLGSAVFWNGMIRVYICSVQLGIKWRVIGAIGGWIPLIHLWVLAVIIHKTQQEVKAEQELVQLNELRAESKICRTRYPVLLVHGVFFRDTKWLNYWGRIPFHLKQNGASVFYGEHESAASVAVCGQQIAARIRQITSKTGCEKVNLIAHSKGGLDCRYAISCAGAADQVASLTTINTPHRGCLFAEVLLEKIPESVKQSVARRYNTAARELGDREPDFLEAVSELTVSACGRMNAEVPDAKDVYYQSVGSQMNQGRGGQFPLNLTYHLVKHYSGANDGLVDVSAMRWGEKYILLKTQKGHGISHGDIIDLNRKNGKGFEVREFYARLLQDLKEKGL